MATYFMFGRYSAPAVKEISKARTKEVERVIEQYDGKLRDAYALLGQWDLAFIVEWPGIEEALQASVQLTKATGISFSCAPAIAVEEFDKLVG